MPVMDVARKLLTLNTLVAGKSTIMDLLAIVDCVKSLTIYMTNDSWRKMS